MAKPIPIQILILICVCIKHGCCTNTRKNVLFLAVDDLRPEMTPYFGNGDPANQIHPDIYTPNLARLAAKSLVSLKTYSQYALCTPSRASFMTGRRPDTTQVYQLNRYFRETGGNFTTIPQYFKEHGYSSIGLGKIYHAGDDDPISWTEAYYNPPNRWADRESSVRPLAKEEYANMSLPDMDIAIQTIKALRSAVSKGSNFFIAAGFHKPHLPYTFPEEYLSLYPKENISIPENNYAPVDMPDLAWFNWLELRNYEDIAALNQTGEMNDTLPDEVVITLRQGYYSCVSHVDEQIGLVLNELELLEIENDTIIVLLGDHGFLLGEHGGWCKQSTLELATRVPLMLHVQGYTDSGIIISEPVELVDIFPTLAETAGLPLIPLCPNESEDIEVCTEGMSLVPYFNSDGNNTIWKKLSFSQFAREVDGVFGRVMGYSVRDMYYRYAEWVGFNMTTTEIDWDDLYGTELYDYTRDPEANYNIAGNPEYAEIEAALQEVLHEGWRGSLP